MGVCGLMYVEEDRWQFPCETAWALAQKDTDFWLHESQKEHMLAYILCGW